MFFNYENLTFLLKKQKLLDEIILKKSNSVVNSTIILKQVTALNVELGELANEMKFFKHWQANPNVVIDKIMMEYVDVLHFLLSISLFLDVDYKNFNLFYYHFSKKFSCDAKYIEADDDERLCLLFAYIYLETSRIALDIDGHVKYIALSEKAMFKLFFLLFIKIYKRIEKKIFN